MEHIIIKWIMKIFFSNRNYRFVLLQSEGHGNYLQFAVLQSYLKLLRNVAQLKNLLLIIVYSCRNSILVINY